MKYNLDNMMASRNEGMENLIPIVNKLQDVCTQTGTTLQFDWPQIVVIGSESAGKSSVLENIVGRDFLPRGKGIVTRRPLILQLINRPEEYGEFNHYKDDSNNCKKFYNFADIRAEIEAETDRETGSNKGISDKPINLRIYSPKVLDLTLVDLPGITKVPVGDQPADIEEQIKKMILKFIRKENCLILAVSPANFNLANSDALKLAKEVDANGLRTIGVITKLDLMDDGTDARDIFNGKLLPLRRGYIGVVNRSQKDIDNQKDMAKTLEDEGEFFNKHPYYRHIAGRLGTPYLQKVLNKQLTEHIRKTIGSLQEKTRTQMYALEKDISSYENLHPSDPSRIKEVMFETIFQLQSDFEKEMGSLGSHDIHTDRFSRGAKVRCIFQERLKDGISNVQYDEDKLRHKIVNAINSAYGVDGIFNEPFKAFEALVKEQIELLEDPIKVCIKSVVEELKNAVQACIQRLDSHPKFRDYIKNNIMTFIDKNTLANQKSILSLVKMESSYMNSMHYEFKNDKQNGLAAELIEQIAALPDGLTFDQRKGLVDHLIKSGSLFMTSVAGAQISEGIREGILILEDDVLSRGRYWFVLKSYTLSCFDVVDHSKIHLTFQLNGLKFRLKKEDGAFASSKQTIILFKPSGGHVHQNYKEVKLSSANAVDIRLWMKSLSSVIEPDDTLKYVDVTYGRITSYMSFVKRTMCDMVPKAITLFIIRELEKYIKKELLKKLPDENLKLFEADEEEVEKYQTKKKMHETCKNALEILREC